MTFDVYQNGRLLYSIEGTDNLSPTDIAIVSRNVLQKAVMTPEGFDDVFFDALKVSKTHKEAYQKAEEVHYKIFGAKKYTDFESYRTNKTKRLRR